MNYQLLVFRAKSAWLRADFSPITEADPLQVVIHRILMPLAFMSLLFISGAFHSCSSDWFPGVQKVDLAFAWFRPQVHTTKEHDAESDPNR